MPGIVRGEKSSCSNPILPFFYQEQGFLLDLHALRYQIYSIATGTAVHEATINTDECAVGGLHKALGYYVADFDPVASSAAPGAYEIVWYYKTASDADEQLAAYRFEVLDPKYFRVSSRYVAYLGSDHEAFTDFALEQRQRAIEQASRTVEQLTGRFFFPRYMTLRHNVRPESRRIWLDEPIIGVGRLAVESASTYADQVTDYDLDVSTVRVLNRHLDYLLSPDDRDNPGIVLEGSINDGEEITVGAFPVGTKNVLITGAFGYTEPDGGPFGQVPLQLQEVIVGLTYRQLQDPTGTDPMLQNPGRVKMAKTRDQQIQFDTRGSAGDAGSTLTGDPRLDNILIGFCRPPHVGVAG